MNRTIKFTDARNLEYHLFLDEIAPGRWSTCYTYNFEIIQNSQFVINGIRRKIVSSGDFYTQIDKFLILRDVFINLNFTLCYDDFVPGISTTLPVFQSVGQEDISVKDTTVKIPGLEEAKRRLLV